MRRTASTRFVDSTRGAGRRMQPAFTLVELLVVVGVILVLLGLVVGAGVWAVEKGKQTDTRAMFALLDAATDQYKEETGGTLGRIRAYARRYGGYPADEMQVFRDPSEGGIPGSNPPAGLVGDNFIEESTITDLGTQFIPTSTVALVLTVRQYSQEAAQMLERVDPRFKATVSTDLHYWERDGNSGFTSELDETYDYFVDAWGSPVEYFSTRDASLPAGDPSRAGLSTQLIKLNNGRPVFVSYGPNGPDQLSGTLTGAQTLRADWSADGAVNDPLNHDNVYSVPDLGDKLRR